MAGFIELVGVGYTFPGGRRLFSGVSFRVADRERVALVGANGVGKTTLLRLVADNEGEHEGLIRVIGRLGRMPQLVHQPGSEVTVRELLLRQAPVQLLEAGSSLLTAERRMASEPTESAGAGYAEAVHKWGELGGYDLEITWNAASVAALRAPIAEAGGRVAASLSGGELKRLLLEALFRSDTDVLLLDEPDNFLDVTGKEWLEAELRQSRRTILYVSHDREFLAHTTTQVVTLEAMGSWTHPESFKTYDEARQKRLRNLEEDHRRYREQREALVKAMKEFKRRAAISPKFASRAQASETRLRHFDERTPPPDLPGDQKVIIRLEGGRTGTIALRLKSLAFPELVQPFSAEILSGQRVAIIGRNGTGKSHFLRLLAGEPLKHTGEMMLGARVQVGYFSQVHDTPALRDRTPLHILQQHGLDRTKAMGTLRRYELDQAFDVPFEKLSGGQQARLQILLLEVEGSTMLALDEPTDNLDVASADALEFALSNYEGTIIAATHDRWFLKSFERFLIFQGDGRVTEGDEPRWI